MNSKRLYNIGIKLYITDTSLINQAKKLHYEGLYQFVELYVVPDFSYELINEWEKLDVQFIFHAAHSAHGINLAQEAKEEHNRRYFKDLIALANKLNARWIIVHGGNDGTIMETIRQIKLNWDKRIIIENKPQVGLNDQLCIGWSPDEIKDITTTCQLDGFVLDFAHATCAAFSSGRDLKVMFQEFFKLNPLVFHLSDGYSFSEKDIHLNLGNGNFDLEFIKAMIPQGGLVTLETPRDKFTDLEDFIRDVKFFNSLV